MRKIAALALAVAVTAAPGVADAFCGFYVSPSDAPLANDATMVALMRDGTRTVLSMSNNYKGPLADFAMVVPVPVVLKKEDVKTLPREVFGKLETLTAPRLVEYWEQDPCGPDWGDGIGLGTIGGFGHGSGMGYGGGGGNYHVKVEAQFAVGEYQIVILSAEESDGLERWLKDNGYKIPDGAAAALAPYVKEQQKFFVAKVDPKKTIKDETGAVVLSPLRFHYESTDFRLPVRLGLLNAQGPQDLVVFTIGRGRYEVANHPNAFAPTNLDVADEVRASFRPFYAKLFDATIARTAPDAVVTEYAWTTGSCDPCPSPTAPLTLDDLATLGTDVVPSLASMASSGIGMGFGGSGGGTVVKLIEPGADIEGKLPPDVIKRIVRANFPRFRACYQAGLKKTPSLAGTVSTKLVIDSTGAVESASLEKGTLGDAQVSSCVLGVFKTLSFPEPESGKVKVTYPIDFQYDGPAPTPQPIVGSNQLTITRLHTRYTAATLGADLVFRMASPVVGGREMRDAKGAIEKGTVPASVDAFQARYAIRHPWTGPVECPQPKYGRWGGPPAGVEGSTQPTTATKLASAPRGPAIVLAKLVRAGLEDVAAWDRAAGNTPAAGPPNAAAPTAKHTTAGRRSGWRRACHCAIGDRAPMDAEVALPVTAVAIAAVARRRRRRVASS